MAYSACTGCEPTANAAVANDADPPDRAAEPSKVVPSKNPTVPDAAPPVTVPTGVTVRGEPHLIPRLHGRRVR